MNTQQQLELGIIWFDADMVEVQAFASNGRYCGMTQVYATADELLRLANELTSFPKKITDVVEFEAGERGGYSFLGLKFYCVDGVGHTAVYVSMEEKIMTLENRPEEKHKVSLEIRYEAGLIDQFSYKLLRMARNQSGSVNLF